MKSERLAKALERVEAWPADAQDELAEIALDIEAGLGGDIYKLSPEERDGVERGLRDAEQGRFATEEEVEATFAKFRPK